MVKSLVVKLRLVKKNKSNRPPYHLFLQQSQCSVQSYQFALSVRRVPVAAADVGLDARSLAVHLLDVPPGSAAGVQDAAQAFGQRRQPLR